jgi:DNA polymerase alpha subunit B
VTVLPNPATFIVGGAVIGAVATDVVFQLNAEECARAAAVPRTDGRGDKISRCAAHMLDNRSYYPLFPAGDPATTPLEVGQLWHVGMPVCPDVLIAPSRLRTLAKLVDSTLIINPGSLSKLNAGGTYAKVLLAPPVRGASSSGSGSTSVEGYVPSRAPDRLRADVVKI